MPHHFPPLKGTPGEDSSSFLLGATLSIASHLTNQDTTAFLDINTAKLLHTAGYAAFGGAISFLVNRSLQALFYKSSQLLKKTKLW